MKLSYLFKLEAALIYQESGTLFGTNYYWGYEDGDRVYGPFYTIKDCTQHAAVALYASNRTESLVKNNVILVDFKTKKRVP